MIELSIRRATVSDALILSQMEKECFTDSWNCIAFENFLSNPAVYFIIAENRGRAVAYGGMTVVMDECDIVNIAVMEDMRRMGIGRILVKNMLDICRGAGVATVFLEHRESNTAAAALYEEFGFIPYDIRRRYYTSPVEDAILRSLTL